MTNDDAKFILGSYRPNGRDATDSLFAEPLALARRDPELGVWFKAQLAFDAEMSARLREAPPPPGLRETIIAGAQVSRRPTPWLPRMRWFALAAAITVLLAAGISRFGFARPEIGNLTRFALHDTAFGEQTHLGSVTALRPIEARLAATPLRSDRGLDLDLARLRGDGCRTVRVAGREVFEICFGPEQEFHLYFARRGDFTAIPANPPDFAAAGRFSTATWADSRLVYSLVTTAGMHALRQRL